MHNSLRWVGTGTYTAIEYFQFRTLITQRLTMSTYTHTIMG